MTNLPTAREVESGGDWYLEQKRDDVFEEIICNSERTHLSDLRRVGWNGIPDRFRAPSWQLLLHYLPVTPSKRKSAIRRKRNEYHRHITKYYFEFDFGLTDRGLVIRSTSSSDLNKDIQKQIHMNDNTKTNNSNSNSKDDSRKVRRRNSIEGLLQTWKNRSDRNLSKNTSSESTNQINPTFPTQSIPGLFETSPPNIENLNSTEDNNSTRIDSLLLQIRHDINRMVIVPTKSETPTTSNAKTKPSSSKTIHDLSGSSGTTRNRLFAHPTIKASLERILYLWSIRYKDDYTPQTQTRASRYVPGLTDLIYPIYLSFIQGYIWGTHLEVTRNYNENDTSQDNEASQKLNGKVNTTKHNKPKLTHEYHDHHSDAKLKSTFIESTVLENEERLQKIKLCHDLSIGQGIHLIPEEVLDDIEADTYWCFENLTTAIQDYRSNSSFYDNNSNSSSSTTTSKPKMSLTKMATTAGRKKHNKPKNEPEGIQRLLILMENVIQRVDTQLHSHLKKYGVEYIWFAFRWIDSLHARDLNEPCLMRLWDTCLCEEGGNDLSKNGSLYFSTFGMNSKRVKTKLHLSGFHSFQVYVCAALLHRVRDVILQQYKFEDILFQLRNLSLQNWKLDDIAVVLSQAYAWKEMFNGSENQLLLTSSAQYGNTTVDKWISTKCHWPPRKELSRPSDSIETLSNVIYGDVQGKIMLNP